MKVAIFTAHPYELLAWGFVFGVLACQAFASVRRQVGVRRGR